MSLSVIDILSSSNYCSFNIKLAHIFGLHSAIYLTELININEKACRKNKLEVIDSSYYFTVDRSYIESRTTLSIQEQYQLDKSLQKVEILNIVPNRPDVMSINYNLLLGLTNTQTEANVTETIERLSKKKTKVEEELDKIEGMRHWMQAAITTTVPELRIAWYAWIESVLERFQQGGPKVTKAKIIQAQKDVSNFAKDDISLMVQIVERASLDGYLTMQYTLDEFRTTVKAQNPQDNVISDLGSVKF